MADRPNSKVKTNFQPCIIVHGGAWAIPDILMESSVKGVKKAAEIGYESLITVKVLFFLQQWSSSLVQSSFKYRYTGTDT